MTKKLTYEYVKENIESTGCKLLSKDYVSCEEKLNILFLCGHESEKTFSKFKTNLPICPKCAGNVKYTVEEIKEKLYNYGFMLAEGQEYVGANFKIDFYDNDGYKYNFSMHCLDSAYKRGFNVGRAFEKRNKYVLDNMKLWLKKNNKDFSFTCDEYKSSHTSNIHFECNVCGYKWITAWSNIYSTNTGCPGCCESHSENFVRNFLEKNNIKFNPQHKFENCIDKRALPFDFYLIDYNVACECQGIQHFEPITFFGGLEIFKTQKIRDQIKKNYCIENAIKLIEIPYWDFKNIEIILTKELNL